MDFQNMHVSQEEYAQAMHDAVNAYYAHAMNDPSMSQEEAQETTAAMAERALNAIDEFAANEAAANEAAANEAAASEAEATAASAGSTGQETGTENGANDGAGLGGNDGEGGEGDGGIE